MESPDAPNQAHYAGFPWPNTWELREITLRLLLMPFVLAPRPVGMAAARALAAYVFRSSGWTLRSRRRKCPPALASRTGMSVDEFARGVELRGLYERILLQRAIVFPWWRRKLAANGLSHVRAALAEGNGVILWVHPCIASNVGVKQAMFMASHPLAHLSRRGHPFSDGPFGRRFVNPILRAPEVRFLAERIVIEGDRSTAPVRRLRKLLSENKPVSITVTTNASRLYEHPLFGGVISLPTGPVELAWAANSPLLPVFTWTSSERTHVEFGPPLPVTGKGEGAVREAQAACVRWLEEQVVRHPDAWTGWRGRQFQPVPPA